MTSICSLNSCSLIKHTEMDPQSTTTTTTTSTTTTQGAIITGMDPQSTHGAVTYHYAAVGVLWCLIAVGVFALVWWYASKRTAWYVYVSTWLGWVMPFTVVFLLPVDMTSTRYTTCLTTVNNVTTSESTAVSVLEDCSAPLLYVSGGFLQETWRTIYWMMFLLTFLVIPMVQAYCDSGYFTHWDKLKKAVRANLIYYGVLVVVGLIGLAVLGIGGGFSDPWVLS